MARLYRRRESAPFQATDLARPEDITSCRPLSCRFAGRQVTAAPGRAMTDQPAQWLSVLSDASLEDLSARMGRRLDRRRFRGNLWIEGAEPWAEFGWAGRELQLGTARLRVTEPIGRCSATMADPETGRRDADTLAALRKAFGHEDFGVFVEVLEGGEIAPGDALEVL